METQKCSRCNKDMQGYDLLKAKIEQKMKPTEVDKIYCKVCLPIVLQRQNMEKAREEIKKMNGNITEETKKMFKV